MRAGQLRHRIEIDQSTPGRDAAGGVVKVWTPFASRVPADVLFQTGAEVMRADAPQALAKASFLIRQLPGVLASMRVRFDGKVYDIKSVQADRTNRRFVYLVCEQGLNNG